MSDEIIVTPPAPIIVEVTSSDRFASTSTFNVVTKTSNYTVLNTDEIIMCNATSGSFSITLPTANLCSGRRYFFKKTDSSNNLVTLVGTVESDINPTLGPGVDDVTIFSDGSNFYYWGF